MTIKKIVFVALGCCSLALGTLGVFLPVLPTTPFYLAALFFFANSSARLHRWFLGTKLYQKHLASLVEKRGMRRESKLSVIASVTLLMGFGFVMMARKGVWIPCAILALVWAWHVCYFVFRVKTLPRQAEDSASADEESAAQGAAFGGDRMEKQGERKTEKW